MESIITEIAENFIKKLVEKLTNGEKSFEEIEKAAFVCTCVVGESQRVDHISASRAALFLDCGVSLVFLARFVLCDIRMSCQHDFDIALSSMRKTLPLNALLTVCVRS